MIPQWQAAGYRVELYFLRLPNPELAISRVARRVRHGGHRIPAETIRRRFHCGAENLRREYLGLVDEWFIFDAAQTPPQLLEHGTAPSTDSDSLMEDPAPYSAPTSDPTQRTSESVDRNLAGIDAAMRRGAAKALARDRAAGLEPITTELHEPLLK